MLSLHRLLQHPAAKPLVFVMCLLPFAWLFYGALTNQLGANPAEALIRALGDWTLRFICIVLARLRWRAFAACWGFLSTFMSCCIC